MFEFYDITENTSHCVYKINLTLEASSDYDILIYVVTRISLNFNSVQLIILK